MLVLDFIKKALVAGTLVTTGVLVSTADSLPPPSLAKGPKEVVIENHQSSSTSSRTTSARTNSRTTSDRGSSGRTTENSNRDSHAQNIVTTEKPETKHCKVLLAGSGAPNYQILSCDDSEKHPNLSLSAKSNQRKWYLHDQNKQTLVEIAGFLIENERGWKWRWWGGGWEKLFVPFQGSNSPLWRNKQWQAWRWTEDRDSFARVGPATFDLSRSSTTFPYWNALRKTYSTWCQYYQAYDCQLFQLNKEDLSEFLSASGDMRQVCLQRVGRTDTWNIIIDCATENKWVKQDPERK